MALQEQFKDQPVNVTTRRSFLRRTAFLVAGLAGASGILASCTSQPAPQPTTAPAAPAPTQAPAKPAAAPTTAPAAAPTTAPAAAAPTKPAAAAPTQAPAVSGGPVKRGGTLNVVIQNDSVTYDPVFNTAEPNGINMIYGEWIRWAKDAKTAQWGPQPEMIAEWDLKPDAITFKLQKGIKFHDGTPWDAKAAKWNIDRMTFHPASNMKAFLTGVDQSKESKDELEKLKANAEGPFEFSSKAVEVVDENTVKLNVSAPVGHILTTFSNALQWNNPISPTAYNKVGRKDYSRNPVGAGPYRFVEWKTGSHISVERNPDYWKKAADGQALPYIDKIVYRLIIDDSVRLLELKSGNAQFMELVQGKDIAAMKSDPNLVLMQTEDSGNNYRLIFDSDNDASPFGKNLKLRQALLYALDREAMAKTLGFEAGVGRKYLLPKGSFAYDESLPFYWFDNAKAQALVKEAVAATPALAGPDGKIAATLSVIDRAVDKMQSEMIKQMADAVGFNIKLETLERAAWTAKLVRTGSQAGGKFDLATMRNPVVPADPDDQWRTFFYSKGSFNVAHLSSPEWDGLIDKGASNYDMQARKGIYSQLEKRAYDEAWYGWLWQQNWNWLFSKKLKNFQEAVTNRWLFTETWLE